MLNARKDHWLSAAALGIRLAGAVVQFLLSWLILKVAGLESVGVFFTGLLIGTGVAVVAKQGMDIALVQYLPGRHIAPTGQIEILACVLRHAGVFAVVLAGAVSLTLVLLARQGWLTVDVRVLVLMTLSGVGMSLNMVVAEYCRANGRVIVAGLAQFITVPVVVVLAMAASSHLNVGQNISAAVWWCAVWNSLGVVEMWFYGRSGKESAAGEQGAAVKQVQMNGRAILKVHVLGFSISWMDLLLANGLYDQVAVGVYGMLSKIAMAATFATAAVTAVYGRQIASAFNRDAKMDLQQAYGRARRTGWCMIGPMLLLAVLLHQSLLERLDAQIGSLSWLLVVMLCSQAAALFFGPANFALIMTGGSARVSRQYAVGILVMVLCAVLLQPVFGIYAVATGVLAGHVVINLLSYLQIRKWFL